MNNYQSYSNLETECLFGEEVEVNRVEGDFALCHCSIDNYKGWLNINDLGILKPATHKIIVIRTFVHIEPNKKSMIILDLPFGSLIKLESISNDWAKVELPFNLFGYLPKNHIVKKDKYNYDWVSTAKLFINVPYKWGGRNSLGIDCSALVQLSLQYAGIYTPRNSSDQEKMKFKKFNNINKIKKGSLIFWPGHVAVALNKDEIIHASGFHMLTVKEELGSAIERINKNVGEISSILDIGLKTKL